MTERVEKIQQKLKRRVAHYEVHQLMKQQRSEELESLEEVFDRSTLMIVYRFLNQERLKQLHGVVRSGKEARLYRGIDPDLRDVAVKIYLTTSAEFRKGRLLYIEGDPRFRRIRKDTRSLVYLWAHKEFRNLEQAYAAGVRVPKPIFVQGNVLLMEFIGVGGEPAPLLREAVLKFPANIYHKLIQNVRLLYRKAELVHGDLSEYNVMIWMDEPVIFDVSQAVSIAHPMAQQLLKRDLMNLNSYFARLGVTVVEVSKALRQIVGSNGG